MKEYPYPPIKNNINGKEVSIIGFEHTSSFFNDNEFFFINTISENDAILLEQPIGGEFWENKEFFGRIGDVLHAQGKRVYIADPANWSTDKMDKELHTTGRIAQYLGLGMLLPSAYFYRKMKSEDKLSRRNFLKLSGLGIGLWGAGNCLDLGTVYGMVLRGKINRDSLLTYGLDDIIFFGETDYRNVKIAEGIIKICNQAADLTSIASLHGAAHWKTVDYYTQHPGLRNLKKLFYLPYEGLGERRVREYMPKEEGWFLARQF